MRGLRFPYSSLPTGGPIYAAQRMVPLGLGGVVRAGGGTGVGSGRCETRLDLEPDELVELDLLSVKVGVVERSLKVTFLDTVVEDSSAFPLALALATLSFSLL